MTAGVHKDAAPGFRHPGRGHLVAPHGRIQADAVEEDHTSGGLWWAELVGNQDRPVEGGDLQSALRREGCVAGDH